MQGTKGLATDSACYKSHSSFLSVRERCPRFSSRALSPPSSGGGGQARPSPSPATPLPAAGYFIKQTADLLGFVGPVALKGIVQFIVERQKGSYAPPPAGGRPLDPLVGGRGRGVQGGLSGSPRAGSNSGLGLKRAPPPLAGSSI